MATDPENQDKVKALGRREQRGPQIVSCFGYHPWFAHRYTLHPGISKTEHYRTIFPKLSAAQAELLETLLPFLPEPLAFQDLLFRLRRDLSDSVKEGRMTMLGEVGLDGAARVRWPHMSENEDEDGSTKTRLTPFKTTMTHQISILKAQLEIAVELGVNISLHCVAAAGPTFDVLLDLRNRHRAQFTNRLNVDVHSGGGFSPEMWRSIEKNFTNVYASPSIFITSRSPSGSKFIASVSADRLLVESDSDDVRVSSRLVWAAASWIADIKGWKLEDDTTEKWAEVDSERDEFDKKGRLRSVPDVERWTVRTSEQNWKRFMRLEQRST
ncbi:hypothetical protein P7C73_g773, partial [Tremellales sp. Uapishka_1]